MDIADIVNKFGLPVGLLLYFIWQNFKTNKEYNDYIKDIASKVATSLDKDTETVERNTTAISRNTSILERIENRLNHTSKDA